MTMLNRLRHLPGFAKNRNKLIKHAIGTSALAVAVFPLANTSQAATDTPVAKAVYVQALNTLSRQGNALVTAEYDQEQWSIRKQKPPLYQKISTEAGTIALRDDGREGDEKAYDGIYSAITEFDFDALIKQYDRLSSFQLKSGKAALPLRFAPNRQLLGAEKLLSATSIIDAIKTGARVPLVPIGIPIAINKEKSLLIRDPAVVQDPSRTFDVCTGSGNPNGVWTFKHLMTEMANTPVTGVTPEEFVRMWLAHWETDQSVNGWVVPDRSAAIHSLIIDPWEAASGGPGSPLNLDLAPFQLLAIVNRVDLRDNLTYGGGSAGEGRFVFQVMDSGCNPTQFTVIFEYGIEKNSCTAVKGWGQQWADLGSMVLGSPAYNTALENITESFVQANAAPSKPNGSALNQLRTNENQLQNPWQLREFVISNSGWNRHFLSQTTVNQTPDTTLDGTLALRDFVNSGLTDVPLRWPTIADPFKGGASDTPFLFHWDEPGIFPRQARHEFSLNTCNGCHAGETATIFTHIKPGSIPAALSGFMTGINVTDPADGAPTRHFNDLARRANDLDALVNSSCLTQLTVPVLTFSH